jgi:hypothetical protein
MQNEEQRIQTQVDAEMKFQSDSGILNQCVVYSGDLSKEQINQLRANPVENRVIPQGEPSLSELLEENKRLKDSIEKYKQMVTQILFIMKNRSERNGETQTV